MARTIRLKVYKFEELDEKVKAKIIEKNYDINVDYDWWDCTYEDAKMVGLKISGFDIGRGSECSIEFTGQAKTTAELITEGHGNECETYIAAESFLKELRVIEFRSMLEERDGEEEIEELENEFIKELSRCFLTMLRDNYEYQTSEEAIAETLVANDYEFQEDGSRF